MHSSSVYPARSDVKAISRVMPPHVGALAQLRCMPRPSHGFAAYFAPRPPPWDDQCLLRDDALAEELATRLGAAPAIVMRANGCAVVGTRLIEAVRSPGS